MAHAHYAASTIRPPSCPRPRPPPATPTKSSHSSSRAKSMHSVPPILPSCNYCCNPTHKASECNIPFEDLFCDYCGEKGDQEIVYFAKFQKRKQLWLPEQNLPTSFATPQPKPRHLSLPLRFSPPGVILVRMLRRRSTILTRGRCFKPMPLKLKLYKMKSNHWRPNLLI